MVHGTVLDFSSDSFSPLGSRNSATACFSSSSICLDFAPTTKSSANRTNQVVLYHSTLAMLRYCAGVRLTPMPSSSCFSISSRASLTNLFSLASWVAAILMWCSRPSRVQFISKGEIIPPWGTPALFSPGRTTVLYFLSLGLRCLSLPSLSISCISALSILMIRCSYPLGIGVFSISHSCEILSKHPLMSASRRY